MTISDPFQKYVLTSCHVPGTEIRGHSAKNGKINKKFTNYFQDTLKKKMYYILRVKYDIRLKKHYFHVCPVCSLYHHIPLTNPINRLQAPISPL